MVFSIIALLLLAACGGRTAPDTNVPVTTQESVDDFEAELGALDALDQDLDLSDLDALDQELDLG